METVIRDLVAEADALYALRSEIENVRQSVALLRQAADADYEAAWRLGRAFFFLGQESPAKSGASNFYNQGIDASSTAARLKSTGVEGHFWLGVNLALLAELENPLNAVVHALRAKKALEAAARIDPAFHGAGPLRVLARLQHKLPRILGGGRERAKINFESAVRLAPANTVTRIYFAELLVEMGSQAAARVHLEAALHAAADPMWAFEIDRDRKLASQALRKLDSGSA